MKKILLIGFLSGLFLNLFPQTPQTDEFLENDKKEEQYKDQETQEEKLDFIFKHILEKQISDYNKMEVERDKWKEKYQKIKEGSSASKINMLKKDTAKLNEEIENLESKNQDLNNNNNSKDKKILELKKNKTDLSKLKQKEKKRIETEISYIFKHEGLISEDLLKITKKRASSYRISQNLISDLDNYIVISKKIIQAKKSLTIRFNDSEIKEQLNILKIIENNKFDWLQNETISLIELLDLYCSKNTELRKEFNWANEYGDPDQDLIDELKKKLDNFRSFPFLFKELNQKIKDPNYKSQVQECY